MEIGDTEIPCHVLENSDRILSTRGIMKSLKRTWRGRKYASTQLPVFLEANNLKPFISSDLGAVLNPVIFRTDKGGKSEGYRAEILPIVCEVHLTHTQGASQADTSQQETWTYYTSWKLSLCIQGANHDRRKH